MKTLEKILGVGTAFVVGVWGGYMAYEKVYESLLKGYREGKARKYLERVRVGL